MWAKYRMFTAQPLRQDWNQDLPKYWNDNSPFKTHFLNALSITFPEGEKFFIQSIKSFKDQITDPQQITEIEEFIKQETWHRYAHTQYNDWLDTQGLPAKQVSKDMNKFWHGLESKWSKQAILAATIGIEHITATNSELMLRYRNTFKRMDPQFEQIWRWHAIEEIEHKSVAMDVWNVIKGPTWLRRVAMIYVLVYYLYFMSKNTVIFLNADKQLWKWQTVKDAWVFLCDSKSGIFRCSFKYMIDFMRADWHPNQTDHSQLLKYSKV